MLNVVQSIFTVFDGVMVLLSLYGAVTSKRRFYLSGLCFYQIIPIVVSWSAYKADKAPGEILLMSLAIIQLIITIPDKALYGRDNAAASSLAGKIGVATVFINAVSAVFGLYSTNTPIQFPCFHIAFMLIAIFVIVKGFGSKTSAWK
jgi:hypothetical protein